jgi:hypothetical protein
MHGLACRNSVHLVWRRRLLLADGVRRVRRALCARDSRSASLPIPLAYVPNLG